MQPLIPPDEFLPVYFVGWVAVFAGWFLFIAFFTRRLPVSESGDHAWWRFGVYWATFWPIALALVPIVGLLVVIGKIFSDKPVSPGGKKPN